MNGSRANACFRHGGRLVMALTLGLLTAAGEVRGEELAARSLTVTAADGRILRGVVDARSDERTLWLRQQHGGVMLSAAVAWDAVATAEADGDQVDLMQLRTEYAEVATAAPAEFLAGAEGEGGRDDAVATAAYAWPVGARRPPRIRNLEIMYAAAANRDRDVEADGLEIAIAAIGADGLPAAVRGGLRAELFGERRPADEARASLEGIGRWTQRVRAEDFVDGVAVYWLPFRSLAPEREFDLLPDAVLTIELGVFGQGNYGASAPVVVRPFNPLRDNLQLERGVRFFPAELQGAPSPSQLGGRAGRWMHWSW